MAAHGGVSGGQSGLGTEPFLTPVNIIPHKLCILISSISHRQYITLVAAIVVKKHKLALIIYESGSIKGLVAIFQLTDPVM